MIGSSQKSSVSSVLSAAAACFSAPSRPNLAELDNSLQKLNAGSIY
jgi:hypothetical protein